MSARTVPSVGHGRGRVHGRILRIQGRRRRRTQQATCGHRGCAGDPLDKARRILHTGADLLNDKQRQRLEELFTADTHIGVEATWGIYQHMIAAYREKDRAQGTKLMQAVVDSPSAHRTQNSRTDAQTARN